MLQDPLADALTVIKNAERIGKISCTVKASTLLGNILKVVQENGYIKSFEKIEDGRGAKFKIELKGKIVNTNVIKPSLSVKVEEFEKWEKRYLPGRNMGLLIISTPKGVMQHNQAKELHVGGKLISFVY
ncbi:MAG: 30S ribosomal protein S8 [Candidatus Aenigmarchaeota archaeon]|nr:30S ribosomal protein S8 [Candidatus Aenigmarchaeota archaeon]